MKFTDFYKSLDTLCPATGSAAWDNDGVMLAPREWDEVRRVLVALDPTEKAIKYAAENGFDLLLTHHPLIFKGLKSITGADTVSSRVLTALSSGVKVVSLHTRLDSARGGVNDVLLELCGAEYTRDCGDADSPDIGRVGTLPEECDVACFARNVKKALGCGSVRVYGEGKVKTVAALGGSGKDLISSAVKAGADVFVTGESGYNAAEAAAEAGLCIIEAGHYHTEAPVCRVLADHVKNLGLEVEIFEYSPYVDM